MKRILLLFGALICCSPLSAQRVFFDSNAISVDYDSNSNTLLIDYLGCDPCLYGGIDNALACECNNECETEAESCYINCQQQYNGIIDLRDCVNNCRSQEEACQASCGEAVEPITEIESTQWTAIAVWAPLGRDPLENPSDTKLFVGPLAEFGGWTPISPFPIGDPWPEVYTTANSCYRVTVTITYTNGDSCVFVNTFCQIRG